MKLDEVWVVRDPSPLSELEDICWKQEVTRLARYIWGAGPGTWEQERTTFYTDENEAVADAQARLANIGRTTK